MSEHYRSRANRRHRERGKTLDALAPFEAPVLTEDEKLTVTITRFGPRLFDDDNLAYSAKSVRDGVAEWLGIDDRDPRIYWDYRQEKHREKTTLRDRRKKLKPGFRVFCRVQIDSSQEPIWETTPTPGEPPLRREPPIHWTTQPGQDLGVVPPRANGSQLHVTRKRLTCSDGTRRDYVHLAVHFTERGKPYRSRGVAIDITEVEAVLTALQGVALSLSK